MNLSNLFHYREYIYFYKRIGFSEKMNGIGYLYMNLKSEISYMVTYTKSQRVMNLSNYSKYRDFIITINMKLSNKILI